MKNKSVIDFVVPWVDNNDPEWQESFAKYSDDLSKFADGSEKRYRDWELFKYWFRGVEEFAPWVNKVHLVTCGHFPKWLNMNHKKLNFVKHEDYIPREHLPVFSANPIEINLHRIKELSEQFVYFNDDIFLINPSKPTDFFRNGLPTDSAVMTAIDGTGYSPIILNGVRAINNHFSKKEVVWEAPFKWFNIKYEKLLLRNFLLLPWSNFTGFYNYHLANSFLKSTFKEVWEQEKEVLFATSERKFRHNLDVNQLIFRAWQLSQNQFHPISKHKLGDFWRIGVDPLEKITTSIKTTRKPLICLNDHGVDNFDEAKTSITRLLKNRFPNKSSFEL